MSGISLKPIVSSVMKFSDARVMTDFFRHRRVDDAFAVVKNAATEDYYIFYNDGDTLDYANIGDAAAFSEFITDCYGVKFDVTTMRAVELGAGTLEHCHAKDYGLNLILDRKLAGDYA